MRRVVVVGASLAGVHAAEALRAPGYDGTLTVIGAEPRLPYDRSSLSKTALRDGPRAGYELLDLHPAQWYAALDIDLRLGKRAVQLDPTRQVVILADGEEIGYDGLILATGSHARRLTVQGAETGAPVLRTADDCAYLHDRLAECWEGTGPRGRLVVIGAGFVGLEVAAIAKEMGLDVAVVEVAPVPLARVLGDEVGRWFSRFHEAHDIEIHCATTVTGVEKNAGTGVKVHLRSGPVLGADVLVAGVGSRPAVEWLRGSGLQITDGVRCDAYLRTSLPGVVAAGDIARWYNPLFDEDLRIEQWTNAIEQGRYAARSLLGLADGPYADAPYFWSDQFSAKMRFVGRANAAQQFYVERSDEDGLVVLFGRDDVICGALCVNATRKLIMYQQAIVERQAWRDVVPV